MKEGRGLWWAPFLFTMPGKGNDAIRPTAWILLGAPAYKVPMTKKDKIAFIKSSKRKSHVYNDLQRYSDQQLNDLIREIVQGLVRESEIIANAYINGYR